MSKIARIPETLNLDFNAGNMKSTIHVNYSIND